MKAEEAINVFERAKETGFCVSLRGFAKCVGVVPSTVVNWKNNPEQELHGIESTKVQYVKEELEKYEPECVDWQAFRREAAKDILCALVGNKDYLKVIGRIEPETMLAIRFTDELIKQLKQPKQSYN